MARINKTKFAILGCLSIQSMSAYEIKNFMAQSTAYFWMEHEAQLYPTLAKMHEEKLISCREEKAQKAGIRKIYKISSLGLVALKQWLMEPSESVNYRNEFLLKLFFSDKIDKKIVLQQLEVQEATLKQQLLLFNAIEKELELASVKNNRRVFIKATLSYGVFATTAEIEWCIETKKMIAKLK
ncbi:MAG: PadR family transcriptional regulator [Coxiellaceae bacterium]|nr:PadR family transcriptional regulator [Coxiellaceae bacterium]